MKKIRVHVSLGLVGCRRQIDIEVDDDYTLDEIDEVAHAALFELIDWSWQELCSEDDE